MIEVLHSRLLRLGLASVLSAVILSQVAVCPVLADSREDSGRGGGHDEEYDHDVARGAVRRGEAMPLAEVLAKVAAELPGEIVEVEFERDHERWIYEFKVIDASGRLREVYVDAATGRVLSRGSD